jgi:hypothetical protein
MKRQQTFPITPGTTKIDIVLFIGGAGGQYGAADNLSARLVNTPAPPAPLPLNTDLIVNGDFESGWSSTSPLTLNDPSGWFGVLQGGSAGVRRSAYGTYLSTTVQQQVSGGSAHLVDTSSGGTLRQSFDVRGNQTVINQGLLAIQVEGYIGRWNAGGFNYPSLRVRCLNMFGGQLAAYQEDVSSSLSPVSIVEPIPPGTTEVQVDVIMGFVYGFPPDYTPRGCADNITAFLFDEV